LVVNPEIRQLASKGRTSWRLSAAIVLIVTATMIALPTIGLPAALSAVPQMLSSRTHPLVENDDYDPAAAHFFSMLSFDAMSLITPTAFGDFQSPVVVSLTRQLSGIMPQGAGFDSAVSTMLNGIVQQDILPSAGALTVAEFSVGSDLVPAPDGYAATAAAGNSELGDNVTKMTTAIRGPLEVGAPNPICSEDHVGGKLETGGEFWKEDSGAGLGGARSAPAEFPRGVLAGPVMLASPLHGLGPNGERSNLVAAGLAGGWCLSGREPFLMSSPIEGDLLWIALSIVLCALAVMWLSRGARLPAI